MNKHSYIEITFMQYIFLINCMTVGVGFLGLPRILAEKAGTDGWMTLIIAWILTTAASLVVIQVMKKHPEGTVLDLITKYMGKWAGRIGAILVALYFFYFGYTGIIYSILIIKEWLLPQTPSYVIMILLLIPTYTIMCKGLGMLGRYVEIVVLISIWIPLVYFFQLNNAHWLHLFPLLKNGWSPVYAAVPETFYYHVGFAATFILYPFLKDKQHASKAIIISNTMTFVGYLFITIVCFIYFSPDEIQQFNNPTINVLKTIEFKFLERLEMLFIAFYLFVFSMSWIPPLYISIFCTGWLLGKQDHRNHLRALCVLIAVCTYFFMPTFNQSESMNKILGQIGFGFEYIFPIFLLMYVWLHDRYQRGKIG
jgi:spore germination protein (amino acid permease)